eukprot:INCI1352.1.p1 GENE.INCI1352.1~~INCI1352.1.p1  ORF type:complete len:963 (+),score=208.34 INCI1352.1:115-2889(+)
MPHSNNGQLSKKRTSSQQGAGEGEAAAAAGARGRDSNAADEGSSRKVSRLEARTGSAVADENVAPTSCVNTKQRTKSTPEVNQKLCAAAAAGQADEVQQLLQRFSFTNAASAFCKPLRSASERGHTQVVQLLVEAKCDVEDPSFTASLAMAAQNGHAAVVQALLAAEVSGDSTSHSCYPKLLDTAARNGQVEALRALIGARADINHSDIKALSPLLGAASNGEVETVQFLLSAKANLHAVDEVDMAAIDHAAFGGHVGVLKVLIASNVNINECGKRRVWPLLTAAEGGQLETVEFLLEAKADINVCDRDNMSAAALAMTEGHTPVAQSLLRAKATIDEEDLNDLLDTVAHNNHVELIDVLLCLKGDPTRSLHSAILGASHCGGHEGVQRLLKAKADPNHPCMVCALFAEREHQLSCLFIASVHGQVEVARLLLDAKADLDAENSGGDFPLFGAARAGETSIVSMLLESKADVNKTACDVTAPKEITCEVTSGSHTYREHHGSSYKPRPTDVLLGFTSLYVAVQGKHDSTVAALLRGKACPNECGVFGRTPLFVAAQLDHAPAIDMLLAAKADPNRPSACAAQGEHLMSPLLAALWCGSLETAEILLKSKATFDNLAPDTVDLARQRFEEVKHTGCTLLIHAVQDGFERVADLLLDIGVDVNFPDADSFTPVFVAVQERNEVILQRLLQQGADPCKTKATGTFPLYLAAQIGFEAGVRLLCAAKANPHLGKNPGLQPIQIALQKRQGAALRALLEAKADPDATVGGSSAPIISDASLRGDLDLVKVLLGKKADPNKQSSDKSTPIFYASARCAVLQVLLAANADPNVRCSRSGRTALYYAGDHECVQVLCDAKANPNAVIGEGGQTALHIHSERGDARSVEVLIRAKADVEARTERGQTAAAIAAAHEQVLQALEAGKAKIDGLE